MPPRRSAILRWTGAGSRGRFEDSVRQMLKAHGLRGRVTSVGSSVVVSGPEPLMTAAALGHLPGVAWIAAGFAAGKQGELAEASARLAKGYLRRGDRFAVVAEGTGGVRTADAAGAVISKVLDSVRGARVSESAKVTFRVAADGTRGAVGVEVRLGPGGAPMGDEEAHCLASGGVHSSVVSWMALVSGFRVRLVHARLSDDSLLAVARLYSELSNRADPRGLSLEVLEGGSPAALLAGFVAKKKGRIFAGNHAAGVNRLVFGGKVGTPLFLLPEEKFRSEYDGLGIRPYSGEERGAGGDGGGSKSRSFSRSPASVSDVLDGIS